MRRFFLLLLMWPMIVRADSKVGARVEIEAGTQQQDVIFIQRGPRALHLYLIRPAKLPQKALPTLIWVHGGLWRSGDAGQVPPLLFALARQGYACASVDFRPSDEAVYPAQIDDLRAAVRFLRARAQSYSLDGSKIGVAGISTGAHLAAMLAMCGGASCAIDICGPTDLTTLNSGSRLRWDGDGPAGALLGVSTAHTAASTAQNVALAREASPLFHVGKNPPPFLILHGEEDSLVALSQSETFYARLAAAGGDVTYRIYRGEEHGLRGAKAETEAEILTFLAKWLPR